MHRHRCLQIYIYIFPSLRVGTCTATKLYHAQICRVQACTEHTHAASSFLASAAGSRGLSHARRWSSKHGWGDWEPQQALKNARTPEYKKPLMYVHMCIHL